MRKWPAGFASVLLTAVLVAADNGVSAESALQNELVKKAKAEGEVEFWAPWTKEPAENLLKVFTKKFGVKVWVKRMVANDVKLIRGQTEVMQPLAAGAYALFCSAQPYTVQNMIDKGTTNLKIAVPGELLMESAEAAFIRKGSPRSHAAQLLAGWFASTEGQRLVDKEDYKGFPWVEGTFNAKLASGKKVLFCDPECATKAGDMSAEYLRALGLPVTQ